MRIVRIETCQTTLFNDMLIYIHTPICPLFIYLFIYFRKPYLLENHKKAKRKDRGKDKLNHVLATQLIIAINI